MSPRQVTHIDSQGEPREHERVAWADVEALIAKITAALDELED